MKHGSVGRGARRTTTKLNEHLNRRIPGTTNLPAAENATGAKVVLGEGKEDLSLSLSFYLPLCLSFSLSVVGRDN